MDGIRGEVSNKIRSAIKAKLMELGAYVDDELPDYIMVMVANKRSRQQMEDDLQLFLGDSTSTFTSWLHTVLSKLQQVTVNSAEIKKGSEKKRLSSEDYKKEKRKKLKKEKDNETSDKPGESPEKVKTNKKSSEERATDSSSSQFKSKLIKSEPIDPVAAKDSLPNDGASNNSQPAVRNLPGTLQKKSSDLKVNVDDDDDDFINLKADAEADMWGDTEEPPSSAVKNANASQPRSFDNRNETRSTEPKAQEAEPVKHPQSTLEKTSLNTVSLEGVSTPTNTSVPNEKSSLPLKSTASVDSKPAPRIIRISQTIREEQETLKPSSKVVRDPQKEERSPPSPIIFSSSSAQPKEKIEDDSDVFGGHIAQQLRQLPLKLRKVAKLKIQQALVKRVFQSHIVSNIKNQDKEAKSHRRGSSSLTSESQTRRSDHRSTRRHEQQDLRETLRKERQKERDRDRNRERDQRRSRELSRSRKSQPGVSNVARSSLLHRDENVPDPTLASVVRVKPRPQIPVAMQANRSLILKAVAEAQRSVSKVVVRPELVGVKPLTKNFQTNKKPVKERLQTHKQTNLKNSSSKRDLSLPLKQSVRLPSREALKKMSFTVLAKEPALSTETITGEFGDASDEGSFILDPSLNILIQVPASPAVEETVAPSDPIQTEKVRKWIKDVEEATKSEVVPSEVSVDVGVENDAFAALETTSKHASNEDSEEFDDALEVDTTSPKTSDIHSVAISEDLPVKRSAGTQFVVTLDGLDPMLLRSFALENDVPGGNLGQLGISSQGQVNQENHEEEESLVRDELVKEQLLRQELLRQQAAAREQKAGQRPTVAVSPVAASKNTAVKRPASPGCSLESRPFKVISAVVKGSPAERCKFWPSCKNKEKCEFHHPAVPCKLFPNCKFSDRCLYVHPICRFNTACTRADCPYTHTGPRQPLTTAPAGGNHAANQPIKQACKYFPNCSNLSCPFIHPTVCKFGTHCTKPKCQFIHSDKALMTKHKWVRH